jgi:excisionase family DNA binding protein
MIDYAHNAYSVQEGRPLAQRREYVSTKEAAALLGVSPRAVLKWASARRFPGAYRTPGGERRGGDWRIPMPAIEALKRGEAESPEDDRKEKA